jgi:hypothetical protein
MTARRPGAPTTPAARVVAALVLLPALAGACQRETTPPEEVAVVAGRAVEWEEFDLYLRRHLGDSGASLGSDVLSELFDQFVSERLLLRLAVERGLVPQTSPERPAAHRRRAVDRLLAASADRLPDPTAEQVEAYYAGHRDEFQRPERVRLRQILVEEREIAERALALVAEGADFTAVGTRLMEDSSLVADAGDQGELTREDLPPAFADTIFALEPGTVSEVVQAEYGYHLFQVVARLPAEVVPVAEARPEIERILRQQAADRVLSELVEEAQRRYDVSVHERNLPFNYRGRYLDG